MKDRRIILFFVITLGLHQSDIAGASLAYALMKGKAAMGYIASTSIIGAQDLTAAYCLGMSFTVIHELSHALAAKLLYGDPLDIVLGTIDSDAPVLMKIGPFKLCGFAPEGYALYDGSAGTSKKKKLLKDIAIAIAGPLVGTTASALALGLLINYVPGFYVTKAAAGMGILTQTLGIAGIGGINIPGTDAYQVKAAVLKYRRLRAIEQSNIKVDSLV